MDFPFTHVVALAGDFFAIGATDFDSEEVGDAMGKADEVALGVGEGVGVGVGTAFAMLTPPETVTSTGVEANPLAITFSEESPFSTFESNVKFTVEGVPGLMEVVLMSVAVP